jgi:hypothetical protein
LGGAKPADLPIERLEPRWAGAGQIPHRSSLLPRRGVLSLFGQIDRPGQSAAVVIVDAYLRGRKSPVAWPVVVRAQQPASVVTSLSSSFMERHAPALREGLNETGYVDGRNVAVARQKVTMTDCLPW